jgi:nitrogen regulatory protein PII
MKKIEAFIRHEAFEPIRAELLDKGFPSLSIIEAKGSGRQKGIVEQYRGSTLTVNVRPKLKLEVVVEDKDKPLVVETILKHARTGEVGDGYWFVDRAKKYARERVVFDRPIGMNQGVQFPIAECYIEGEAANLMRWRAAHLFDAHQPCGAEANMAKHLAATASWEAANVCLQTHGGFGFACEYDIERKFRETRLYQVAPISTNLIFSYVAEHVLGLPRSF